MRYIALIILFHVVFRVSAQLPAAYVYTISGKASVVRKGNTVILRQKDFIYADDRITVKKSAIVKLLMYGGKFLELNKPGLYAYRDLEKSMAVKSIGITEKYFELIWHELLKPKSQIPILSQRAIGSVIGGASRGGGCGLLLDPLNFSQIGDDTLYFSWKSFKRSNIYRFSLFDYANNEVIHILTKDTSITLLNRGLLKEEINVYYWSAIPDADGSESCSTALNTFTLTSKEEKVRQINSLIGQYVVSDEFRDNMLISCILASNGWFKDALVYWDIAYLTLGAID